MKPLNKVIKAGKILFHENDRSRELYIIQSGKVKVFRTVANREIELASFGKGAVIGEMALIDGKPRSASAKAIEDCEIVMIDADTFFTKIRGVPPWFMSIVKMVSQRIRKSNKRLEEVMDEKHGFNIILALEYFFMRSSAGQPGGQCGDLELRAVKKELSQLLAASPQRVVNALDLLEQNSLINLDNDRISCPDRALFENYCSFVRLHMRKAFDKLEQFSPPSDKVLPEVETRCLFLADPDQKQTEVAGSEIENILQENNLDIDRKAFVQKVKDVKLATVKKGDTDVGDEDASPLLSMTFTINNALWKQYALYYRFKDMVLSA